MIIKTSRLEQIAAILSQYPDESLPEIAFAGRSNVGKSSFINGVLNRKNLAYTSGKPGKTRTVNFYNVNEAFRLVDLPGYGYAAVSRSAKDQWSTIIDTYLQNRDNLREVVLVVDSRHKPTTQDIQMYNWILSYGFTGYVIATKVDKLARTKIHQYVSVIAKTLDISDRHLIMPFSAANKYNREAILERIETLVQPEEQ